VRIAKKREARSSPHDERNQTVGGVTTSATDEYGRPGAVSRGLTRQVAASPDEDVE
jgi:hypothetical protein